jgi:hypothetical protein
VPEDISFNTFFKYCYGATKRPGTETEHCEQTLPAAVLDENITQYQLAFMNPPAKTSILGLRQRMEAVLAKTLREPDTASAIGPLLRSSKSDNSTELAGTFVTRQLASLSQYMVLGSSGSGEQRRDMASIIDALIHGERRWFMMGEKELRRFMKKAGSDFQPASAFVFFEDQLAALKEEWGLEVHLDDTQARSNAVWQCDQQPGDVLYVPPQLYRIGLSLQDSVSYLQHLIPTAQQVAEFISQRLWAPAISVWQMGVCLLDEDGGSTAKRTRVLEASLRGVAGWEPSNPYVPNPPRIAEALVKQFGVDGHGALTVEAQASSNDIALDALLLCRSVLELHPQVPITTSLCMTAIPFCTRRLVKNARDAQERRRGKSAKATANAKAAEKSPPLPRFVEEGLEDFRIVTGGGTIKKRETTQSARSRVLEEEEEEKKKSTETASSNKKQKKKKKSKKKKKKKKKRSSS